MPVYRVLAASARPSRGRTHAEGSSRPSLEEIATEILENENALKTAFQPGKAMPSVRTVQALLRSRARFHSHPAHGNDAPVLAVVGHKTHSFEL